MGVRLRRTRRVMPRVTISQLTAIERVGSTSSPTPKSEHPTHRDGGHRSSPAFLYTEKVIKRHKAVSTMRASRRAAYTQVQLALTSLIIGGTWALVTDWTPITTKGLWYGFDYKACIAAVNIVPRAG